MKVRFYCDVPPIHYNGASYTAYTMTFGPPSDGYTRYCFDVDLPVTDHNAEAQLVRAEPAHDIDQPGVSK